MPEIYKTSQAAEYVGLNRMTLTKLANEGKIDFFITPGGQKRYLKEALDKYLGIKKKE